MTPSSARLQRALLLQEQHRHADAELEFRQHLAEAPGDALAHSAMALSLAELDRLPEAEDAAREAIGLDPGIAFPHYALARVLSDRNREREAAEAIDEAIRIEPGDADYHALRGGIAFDRKRWQDALESAETGLSFDPAHVGAQNLRAMALVKLGRRAEAGETLDSALARDPENALSHANLGWTLLQGRQRDRSISHFRESLRLDPTNDWARAGLVEAIKAGNPLYAVILGYFLWMQRLSPRAQWGILLGGYFGFRWLTGLSRSQPSLAPWLLPVQIAYITFALLTWLAGPLFNALLWFHPAGRHALDGDQRSQARLTVACILAAVVALGVSFVPGIPASVRVAALVLGLLALPVSAIHRCQRGWPRGAMAAVAALLAVLGGAAIALLLLLPTDHGLGGDGKRTGSGLLGFFLIGTFASQWIANGLMSVRPRR